MYKSLHMSVLYMACINNILLCHGLLRYAEQLCMFSGVPLYPVITDGKCMAGTPFIVPQPGPHNPHCYFIYPGHFFSFTLMMVKKLTQLIIKAQLVDI